MVTQFPGGGELRYFEGVAGAILNVFRHGLENFHLKDLESLEYYQILILCLQEVSLQGVWGSPKSIVQFSFYLRKSMYIQCTCNALRI